MPADKLILLPDDPHVGIANCHDLVTCLQGIGLMGEQHSYERGVFYPAGEQFLQLISFLGCSPSIELKPPQDTATLEQAVTQGRFCHVVPECGATLRFRANQQTRPPRCPNCGQRASDWQAHVRRWQDNPAETQWSCPACGRRGELTDWDFRKAAGFGKVFVEISGIYPAEAIPSEALLLALSRLTGGSWRYMYIKE